MASIADITVYDGAATPVAHTLAAISVSRQKDSLIAEWRENLPSLPVEAQVRASVSLKKLPSNVVQIDTVVEVPVMETVTNQNAAGYTAAPKVAFIDRHRYTCMAHPRSTITSRRLARQILVNLMGNVATSVAAATAGPVPVAVDSLIMPT